MSTCGKHLLEQQGTALQFHFYVQTTTKKKCSYKVHTDIASSTYFTKNAQRVIHWEKKPLHISTYSKYPSFWNIFLIKSKSSTAWLSRFFSTLTVFSSSDLACKTFHDNVFASCTQINTLYSCHQSITHWGCCPPVLPGTSSSILQETIYFRLAALFTLSWPIESCHSRIAVGSR